VSADSLSRIVAAALSDSLGVPVIVDAKPGAGGNIASEFVSRATPDGYTIILLTGGHAISAALYRKLRFHPVDSFDFISLVGTLSVRGGDPLRTRTSSTNAMLAVFIDRAVIAHETPPPGTIIWTCG
jgi:tripartite-type tricarboxylate transporter receptor subunit TctC